MKTVAKFGAFLGAVLVLGIFGMDMQAPLSAAPSGVRKATAGHARVEKSVSPGADLALAFRQLVPGDTLRLEPGEYPVNAPLYIRASGTAELPIVITCDYPGAAHLRGPPYGSLLTSDQGKLWHMLAIRGVYVKVENLEIDGAPFNGVSVEAAHCELAYLRVHHAGLSRSPTLAGGTGVIATGAARFLNAHNLEIEWCAEHGFYFAGAVCDATFADSSVSHCAYLLDGTPKGGQGGAGVQVNGTGGGSERCRILRNYITGSSRQGIIAGVMRNCEISGNVLVGNNGPQMMIGDAASGNRITGNQVASNAGPCFFFHELKGGVPTNANVFEDNIAYAMPEMSSTPALCVPVKIEAANPFASSARNEFRTTGGSVGSLSGVTAATGTGGVALEVWAKTFSDPTSRIVNPRFYDTRFEKWVQSVKPVVAPPVGVVPPAVLPPAVVNP